MEVNNIIKERREQLGLTLKEVAKACEVSESTVSRWESGDIENMKRNRIVKLANILRISPEVIMGWDDGNSIPRPTRIPVLGSIAAGVPIAMITDIVDWEEIDEKTSSRGEIFALRISGDSMEPKISNGDVVLVRSQEDVESGDVAVVSVNGDDATCKRVRKYKDGLELIPMNPTHEPIFFSAEEVEQLPVRILGKVIELRAKF